MERMVIEEPLMMGNLLFAGSSSPEEIQDSECFTKKMRLLMHSE